MATFKNKSADKWKFTLICCIFVHVYVLLRLLTAEPAVSREIYIFQEFREIPYLITIGITVCTAVLLMNPLLQINKKLLWKYAVTLALIIIAFLLVPALRGYPFLGSSMADNWNHVGFIVDLRSEQHLTWYPSIHIIFISLSEFSIGYQSTNYFIHIAIFSLYVIFVGLYVRHIFLDDRAFFIAIGASSILLYDSFFSMNPSVQSFWLIPMVFYLLSLNVGWSIYAALVISVALSFFHPTTAIILIAIHVGFMASRLYINKSLNGYILANLLVVSVISSYWISKFENLGFVLVYPLRLLGFYDEDVQATGSETVASASDLSLQILLQRFIDLYGAEFFFLLSGLFAIVVLIYVSLASSTNVFYSDIIIQYIISGGVGVAVFFYIPFFGGNPTDDLRYLILITTLAMSAGIYIILCQNKLPKVLKKVCVALIVMCVLIAASLSVVGMYSVNSHYSQAEYEGGSWAFQHIQNDREITAYRLSDKVVNYHFGTHTKPEFQLNHVNRDKRLSEITTTDNYVYISSFDLTYHHSVPETQQHRQLGLSPQEVNEYYSSPTNSKIYDNSEVTIRGPES